MMWLWLISWWYVKGRSGGNVIDGVKEEGGGTRLGTKVLWLKEMTKWRQKEQDK